VIEKSKFEELHSGVIYLTGQQWMKDSPMDLIRPLDASLLLETQISYVFLARRRAINTIHWSSNSISSLKCPGLKGLSKREGAGRRKAIATK
jgi:hypothetical protein